VLTLREWRESDIPAIVEACQDPEVVRWTNVPSPYGEEHARDFVAHGIPDRQDDLHLAIVDADSDALVGSIGIWTVQEGVGEIGYWVAAPARRRGVAVRSVRLLVAWAFEARGYARIQLHTLPGNRASERVAEKAGFSREGVLRSFTEMKGRRTDITMFSLLPEEL
jgi:RimJ/RimL family protein N-acetyltransferase